MDRLRSFVTLRRRKESEGLQGYEPLAAGEDDDQLRSSLLNGTGVALEDEDEEGQALSRTGSRVERRVVPPFSWVEYGIFALIGVAMLWAWNMFLAAAPYFMHRFADSPRILSTFQSAIISVSTVTNLAVMAVLARLQSGVSYPRRIGLALVISAVVFALLALSAAVFPAAAPASYLTFTLLMVAASAWATGLLQNGAFAFAAGWGRPEYMQAIMAGQGVAGVLPAVAQVISVLVVPEQEAVRRPPPPPGAGGGPGRPREEKASVAAVIFFLAAVVVSLITLAAFVPLVRRHDAIVESRMAAEVEATRHGYGHPHNTAASGDTATTDEEVEEEASSRKVVGFGTLFAKLHWAAGAVFLCFAVTMFFPVFTAKIVSVHTPPPPSSRPRPQAGGPDSPTTPPSGPPIPRLLQPAAFIPLAFFCWNLGDLLGRMSTALPIPLLRRLPARPRLLFLAAAARALFLPLYLLCNVGGRGAVVPSDLFYLLAVQFPFGLTNGWLGSSAMMAAGTLVDASEHEKEAAGGFMALCLVAGLTAGSLLSFTAAGI